MQPFFDTNTMLRLDIEFMAEAVHFGCLGGQAAQRGVYRPTSASSRSSTAGHNRAPFLVV